MDQDARLAEPPAPVRSPSRSRRRFHTAHDLTQRRRRVLTYVLLAGSFVLMVNALVGENGYLATLRARREYHALADSVGRLQRENQQYLERVRQLKSDPGFLEETARRVLGFIRPGETLVIVRDARPTPPAPPK
jgi:cell division protein FtsB